MAICDCGRMLKGLRFPYLSKGQIEMLGKNTLQVMVGVVLGVLAADYIIQKTPVGQMLGLQRS